MSPGKAKSTVRVPFDARQNGFDLLFKSHPLPMWVYDVKTLAFLEVNDAAIAKYGYTREEFLGMTIRDIRPAEDVPRLLEHLKKEYPSLRYSGEWRHKRKDGQVMDVAITSHILEWEGRESALVMVQDVTIQKRVEQALKESEALYRDLVENSHDLICTHDLEGNLLSVNQAVVKLTGYSRRELLKMNLKDALTPESRSGFDVYLARIRKRGRASGVMRVRTANGETRIWEYNNTLRSEGVAKPVVRGMARDITEQKRAEETLQASEKRFRALIEHGLDNISLLSADGRLLWESPSVNVTLGYEPNQYIGRNLFELIHPDDLEWTRRLYEQLLHQPGGSQRGVFRLHGSNGKWHWVEAIATNMLDNPHVEAIVINYRDVTERKRMEDELQKSERRYRSIAEDMPAMVCRFKPDGTLTFINSFYCEYFGKPRGELLGSNLFSLIPQAEGEMVREKYLSLDREKPFITYEYKTTNPNGEERWQRWTDRALFDEQGEIVEYQSVGEDITERKQAEEALRESEKKLQNVIRHSSSMYYTHTVDHVLTYVSQQSREILDCEPEEAMVRWQEFLSDHPLNRQGIEATERAIASGQRQPPYELELVTRKGRRIWVRVDESPIVRDGRTVAITGSITDITERRLADEKLRRNEEILRLFIEHSPAAIAMMDRDMKYIAVSRRYLLDYRLGDQEIVGKSHYEVFPEIPQHWKEIHRRCLAGAVEKAEEDFFPRADGSTDWVKWEIRPWYESGGEIGGIILFSEIVTQQKLARDAQRESEERFRGLFENSPIPLWEEDFSAVKVRLDELKQAGVADFEAYFSEHPEFVKECIPLVRVLNVNSASLKLYGASSKEELMKNLNAILQGEDPVRRFRQELLNIANGMTYFEGEGRDRSRDGRLLHTALTWSVMPGHEEDLSRVIVSVVDITERKQAEEERRRLIRELSERVKELTFLHNISRIFMDTTRSEEEVLQEVAYVMPRAWQHPDIAAARIGYNGKQYTSPNYRETDWMQSHFFDLPNGDLGFVQIAYLEERPPADEGPFLKEERRLVELTAEKLQTYLHGILADRAIKAHNEELALLLEAGKELNGTFDLQEIYEIVYRYILQSIPCDQLRVFSHDPNAHMLHCEYSRDEEGKQDVSQIPPFPLTANSRDPLNVVLETGTALVLSGDVEGLYKASPKSKGAHSALLVPLVTRGQVSGVMQALHRDLNAYTKSHLHFMESLAFRISAAMSNAKLFNELQAELIERRLIEEEIRQLNAELEKRVRERTAQIEAVKRRFELAAHAGQIGVWEYTPRENKVVWDERMHILHHLPLGTFDGTVESWIGLIHPDDLERSNLGGQMALTENLLLNNEHRIILPDGSIRHLATSAVTVFSESGTPDRVIGISVDITERKKAEEALRIANLEMENALRVKDEFLANMSHELRTPLNAILGISESLEEQFVGALNEKQLKYVQIIRESGRHLLDLINDILDISKIEAGRMELDFRPLSVEKLCQSSLRIIKELAQKKSLNVSFNVRGHVKIVRGDERRLKQLLVNLLGNAVKFTERGKRIGLTVEGRAESSEIVFSVWDEGIGIAEENLPRLFKPFVQLDTGLTKEYHGTGLGLALVAQIARLHGGRVGVESEEGRGSRFTVILPWLPQDQQAEAKVTGELRPSVQRSEEKRSGRILVIEDTDTIVALIEEYLSHLGYQVSVARNGVEGVIAAKKERPDLILMDVMMPVMDGLEAAKIIRTDKELANVPIIAITALAMPGDRERCLAAGMNDYLSKPIRMNDLVEAIERHLHESNQK